MVNNIFDESESLRNCALDLLIGEMLGQGSTRRVYEVKHNPALALKLEYASRAFCNVAEYELWNEVKNKPRLAKFFAPVVAIDIWAGALLMHRTMPITYEEFKAEIKSLPDFMTDNHWANFGRLGGQIVCHDYGYNNVLLDALDNPKMKRVKK